MDPQDEVVWCDQPLHQTKASRSCKCSSPLQGKNVRAGGQAGRPKGCWDAVLTIAKLARASKRKTRKSKAGNSVVWAQAEQSKITPLGSRRWERALVNLSGGHWAQTYHGRAWRSPLGIYDRLPWIFYFRVQKTGNWELALLDEYRITKHAEELLSRTSLGWACVNSSLANEWTSSWFFLYWKWHHDAKWSEVATHDRPLGSGKQMDQKYGNSREHGIKTDHIEAFGYRKFRSKIRVGSSTWSPLATGERWWRFGPHLRPNSSQVSFQSGRHQTD